MTDPHAGSAAPSTSPKPSSNAAPRAGEPARIWLEAFQALADLVAHDLRNALNAVAVNLEVVRGRSARGAEAAAIAPFAATAAGNFEIAAAATEALLGLARPEPGRIDVAALLTRLERLLAISGERRLELTDRSGGQASSAIPADLIRAVVARSVLAALHASERAACEITVDDGIFLRVTGAILVPPMDDSGLVSVARAHGIRFESRGQSLEIRIPAIDHRAETLHDPS